jgi:hypothetical protein
MNALSLGAVILLLFASSPALASPDRIGAIIFSHGHRSHGTGHREIIHLEQKDDVLYGSTRDSKFVSVVVVRAPGVSRSHLILRELKSADGTLSVLLSGPKPLTQKVAQISIVPHRAYQEHDLVASGDGERCPVKRRVFEAPATVSAEERLESPLPAYVLETFGMYWVVPGRQQADDPRPLPANHAFPTAPLGGVLWRGVLPLAAAVLALLVGVTVSYGSHKIDCRAGL